MRLIDGDYLYEKLKSNGIERIEQGYLVLDMIKDEPTVDAVPNSVLDDIKAEIIKNRDRNISGSGNIEEWLEAYRTGFNESLAIIDSHISRKE